MEVPKIKILQLAAASSTKPTKTSTELDWAQTIIQHQTPVPFLEIQSQKRLTQPKASTTRLMNQIRVPIPTHQLFNHVDDKQQEKKEKIQQKLFPNQTRKEMNMMDECCLK